jgi:hypothetical protein
MRNVLCSQQMKRRGRRGDPVKRVDRGGRSHLVSASLFIAIVIAAPAAQAAPRELIGLWSEDPAWCTNPSGDAAPDKITQQGIEHFASACRLTRWTTLGPRAWSASALCREEGEQGTWRRRYSFRLAEPDKLVFSVSGEPASTRVRCATPPGGARRGATEG